MGRDNVGLGLVAEKRLTISQIRPAARNSIRLAAEKRFRSKTSKKSKFFSEVHRHASSLFRAFVVLSRTVSGPSTLCVLQGEPGESRG